MPRILIVDDEADMRMALANVLERLGHEVFEAGDGPAALARHAEGGVDLVLLDMRLPGMDGVEILRRLRERDAEVPIVMVTGYGSEEHAAEVLALGADHYLPKPFSNRELSEVVERVLASRRGGGAVGTLARRIEEKIHAPIAVEAGPLPRPRRGFGWSALLLGLAAAAAALWAVRAGRSRDYVVPFSHPSALVWRGDRLWAADWLAQTVYELELKAGGLRPLRTVVLPRSHIGGLALDGERLYLSDSWDRSLQVRRLDDRLTLLTSVPSPGPRPAALYHDGRYLWSSDAAAGRIYQHDPQSLAVLASFPSAARSPAALFKDEAYLWSADADTRSLFRHRLDNRLRVLEAYTLPELDRGAKPLACMTLRGRAVWIGRDGSSELLLRPLSAFKRRAPAKEDAP
ncbi:MAG: response regulator [Elusimicrobiota bacterium]|jgi:CheY-like chemotaxis protein